MSFSPTLRRLSRWSLALGLIAWSWSITPAHAEPLITTETNHFQFQYPATWRTAANYLIKRAPRDVKRLERRFGHRLTRKIQVKLSSPGQAFAAIQPHGWRPHGDIAGLAYPRRSLITLKIRRIEGLPGLHQTFVHEVAHILFAHASGFRPMPLWLNEGVAMWLSSDFGDFDRFISLARARSGGQIPALKSLERRFPAQPAARKLAYATSLDMTLHLRKQRADFLPATMALVRRGTPWKQALKAVIGKTPEELAKTWQQGLSTRYGWLPLIANEGTVWVFSAFLFVLAYIRVRRERRLQWAQLEDDDEDDPMDQMHSQDQPETTDSEPNQTHHLSLSSPKPQTR